MVMVQDPFYFYVITLTRRREKLSLRNSIFFTEWYLKVRGIPLSPFSGSIVDI